MGNCLKIQLKEVVNNNNLEVLGKLVLKINDSEKIIGCTLKSSNTISGVTFSGETGIIDSVTGDEILIDDKYTITSIVIDCGSGTKKNSIGINVNDLYYCNSLTNIAFTGVEVKGNLDSLFGKAYTTFNFSAISQNILGQHSMTDILCSMADTITSIQVASSDSVYKYEATAIASALKNTSRIDGSTGIQLRWGGFIINGIEPSTYGINIGGTCILKWGDSTFSITDASLNTYTFTYDGTPVQ